MGGGTPGQGQPTAQPRQRFPTPTGKPSLALPPNSRVTGRTEPNRTTGAAGTVSNTIQGQDAVDNMQAILDAYKGNPVGLRTMLFAKFIDLPFSQGKEFGSFAMTAIDVIIRARTGAAMTPSEASSLEKEMVPSFSDSDRLILSKMNRMRSFLNDQWAGLPIPQSLIEKRSRREKATGKQQSGSGGDYGSYLDSLTDEELEAEFQRSIR